MTDQSRIFAEFQQILNLIYARNSSTSFRDEPFRAALHRFYVDHTAAVSPDLLCKFARSEWFSTRASELSVFQQEDFEELLECFNDEQMLHLDDGAEV
ncbi:MAG: hypothetical protein KDB03_10340 [Planctomycetales bacterium]|nr:hypothetical protein [Planctomycetales bacterium]